MTNSSHWHAPGKKESGSISLDPHWFVLWNISRTLDRIEDARDPVKDF